MGVFISYNTHAVAKSCYCEVNTNNLSCHSIQLRSLNLSSWGNKVVSHPEWTPLARIANYFIPAIIITLLLLFYYLVGKTSLITKFMYDSFDDTYQVYSR